MIRAILVGDREVVAKLYGMSEKVHASILKAIKQIVVELRNHIITDHLHGPRPQKLDVVTGRLQNSITTKVEDSETGVIGTVGTNVEYAPIHEYGGVVSVASHLRTITQAFGRQLSAPVTFRVESHTANYPSRSFLRSSLEEMTPSIVKKLREAIDGSTKGMWK